jgi:2-dehydro-3-deoxyglucarate aldolase/4-hydroxy-2-oxoheptanedioate aldolase
MNTVIGQVNTVKAKLKSGKPLLGTHVVNTELQIIELMAGCGFDYLWIDTEHSQADKGDVHNTLMAVRAAGTGTAAFVRVADIDPILVKPILEMGPTGIVFPGAQNAEDVKRAVSSCRYPPAGVRGFGPRGCIRYGLEDITEYVENSDAAVFKIIQLEHKKAYDKLDDILAVEGVDAFVIGPMDLAGSYGYYRDWKHPEVMKVIDDFIVRTHKAGKYIGVSTGPSDEESLGFWMDKGINLISAGNENVFVMTGCKTTLKNMSVAASKRGR